MTPEQWERISEILDQALSFEGAERERYLAGACNGDAELRAEVNSLLQSHEEAGRGFLNVPSARADTPQAEKRSQAGRRIGPYLLQKEIGRGGMGEVFAAVRADGQFEKSVALKVVRSGYDTGFILERFRNERQILAGLDHPNIARLLDGGTTEEGVPYLVMELVDGVPIDAYCDARKLSITERLQLFGQVCSAAQYAHQRLVIHRDIKPSNILVTQDGTPKLVDFGIAKLLDAAGQAEVTMLRPMTPEYASPEQVRGEAVSTASDVYSLGVVLYQLLTGRSPYAVDTRTPAKLVNAITHEEPERPSTSIQRMAKSPGADGKEATAEKIAKTREETPHRLQRRLRGDLDFILLKALRKEPQKRYPSVEQFAEDLRRHLAGLPVLARQGSWNYRAGKFVKRHSAGVAAAALVLVVLIGGIVLTVREARIAEANRKRAEARFNDVRKLAHSLIFEIHDSIATLPGASQTRQLILRRSLEYLDSLAKESGNEPDLMRELATAYGRIGELQGSPLGQNLGDTTGALESLQKALSMRQALARANPGNAQDQLELAVEYIGMSDFEANAAGKLAAAYEDANRAAELLDPLVQGSPTDFRTLAQATSAYTTLGMIEIGEGAAGGAGTVSGGVEALRKALALDQRAIEASPKNEPVRGQEATITIVLGDGYLKLGDRAQALQYYRHGLEILRGIDAEHHNVRVFGNLAVVDSKIGDVLLLEGKAAESVFYYQRGYETAKQLLSVDAHNEVSERLMVTATGQLGYSLIEAGRIAEGVADLRKALKASEAAPVQTPLVRTHQAIGHLWIGVGFERQKRLEEAAQEYATSKGILAGVRAAGANDRRLQVYYCAAVNRLGAALLEQGKIAQAEREFAESVAVLEPLLRQNEGDQEILQSLAQAYTGEGRVASARAEKGEQPESRLAKWQGARSFFEKSLATWAKVRNPGHMNPTATETLSLPAEVAQLEGKCDEQIAAVRAAN